ncbi:hypothetical protein [Polymorphospora rubra]|uniref:SRPBCC domain-containing protein n=1 Tax=Polymorphospora rubra TaxID=338584 RepID=A0A810N9G5_9ACTN|nr:hypothetical protein [Polymorphospora rubra]BCJ68769.1 hypothetical protein Prubr_57900 [Polymorphospora rubra]
MSREFKIVREGDLSTTPEEMWDAITTGSGGWLWPAEFEPRVGGSAGPGSTVTVWDPPRHFAVRTEGEDGWFNHLEQEIEARDGGVVHWRYVHSGIFEGDWESQYDGAGKHTDFYLHTLAQYLTHFSRRPATFLATDAPASSVTPDGLEVLRRGLGLPDDVAQGDRVRVDLPDAGEVDAVVDYRDAYFIGLRTDDAMYRFFGRNAFGAPVGLALHHFGGNLDAEKAGQVWRERLDTVYA